MSRQNAAGELLNLLLHGLHLLTIASILMGWAIDAARPLHLLVLISILVYWYLLGPILKRRGWFGYCLFTDLQWELKKRLGHEVPKWGYIKYLLDRISGGDSDEIFVERITRGALFLALAASLILWFLRSA